MTIPLYPTLNLQHKNTKKTAKNISIRPHNINSTHHSTQSPFAHKLKQKYHTIIIKLATSIKYNWTKSWQCTSHHTQTTMTFTQKAHISSQMQHCLHTLKHIIANHQMHYNLPSQNEPHVPKKKTNIFRTNSQSPPRKTISAQNANHRKKQHFRTKPK